MKQGRASANILDRLRDLASRLTLGGVVDEVELYRLGDRYGLKFDGGEGVLLTPVDHGEFQLWDMRIDPDSYFEPHRHPCVEYMFIRKGSWTDVCTGRVYKPGELVKYERNEIHELRSDKGCEMTMIWMPALRVKIAEGGDYAPRR